MKTKLSDLPEGGYKDVMLEADRRGTMICREIGANLEPNSVLILGLAMIIADMTRDKSDG
jgi:hypothetical protein